MALPRKGSRTLTVDGQALRWRVSRKERSFQLVVEHRDAPGQQLVATVPVALFPADAAIVSPEIVRQCVVLARRSGFDPDAPTGRHVLEVRRGDLDFGRVDRESLKRPVGRPRKRAPGEKRKPVYVSLEPEDRLRLEAQATQRGVGLGTLAREWILERLQREESEG